MVVKGAPQQRPHVDDPFFDSPLGNRILSQHGRRLGTRTHSAGRRRPRELDIIIPLCAIMVGFCENSNKRSWNVDYGASIAGPKVDRSESGPEPMRSRIRWIASGLVTTVPWPRSAPEKPEESDPLSFGAECGRSSFGQSPLVDILQMSA